MSTPHSETATRAGIMIVPGVEPPVQEWKLGLAGVAERETEGSADLGLRRQHENARPSDPVQDGTRSSVGVC